VSHESVKANYQLPPSTEW